MNQYKIELKWALLFTAMALVWMTMEMLLGFHGPYLHIHSVATNFIAIPAFAIYVFALLEKRKKDYGGQMTYMQGFMSGMVISLFAALLSPISQWLTIKVISPDYFPNAIAYAVANGILTQEQAEGHFNLKAYMLMSPIGALVMGALTSAIVAAFIQTKKQSNANNLK